MESPWSPPQAPDVSYNEHMSNRSHVELKGRLLGEPAVDALAETFKVLGDATRVRILDAVARAELCVHDLAALVGLNQSAVSHQLRLLRSMRLVRTRRDGRQIFYALDDDHIVRLFEQGLEHVQERLRERSRPPLVGADLRGRPAVPFDKLRVALSSVEGRRAQGVPSTRRGSAPTRRSAPARRVKRT
jgi:ArsR family transcriptional regulator, lead/cadmium/zinc/bismuth-responsive transcriptional repressor